MDSFTIWEVRLGDGTLLIRADIHNTLGKAVLDHQGLVRIFEMTGKEVVLTEDGVETLRIGKGHPLGGE